MKSGLDPSSSYSDFLRYYHRSGPERRGVSLRGGPKSRCQPVGMDLKTWGEAFEVHQHMGKGEKTSKQTFVPLSLMFH